MRPPTEETEEEKSGKFRLILFGPLALVLVIGLIFAAKRFLPKAPARDPNLKLSDAAMLEKIETDEGQSGLKCRCTCSGSTYLTSSITTSISPALSPCHLASSKPPSFISANNLPAGRSTDLSDPM